MRLLGVQSLVCFVLVDDFPVVMCYFCNLRFLEAWEGHCDKAVIVLSVAHRNGHQATGQQIGAAERKSRSETKGDSKDDVPKGTYLVSGSRDKTIRLWEVSSGRCIKVLVRLPRGAAW